MPFRQPHRGDTRGPFTLERVLAFSEYNGVEVWRGWKDDGPFALKILVDPSGDREMRFAREIELHVPIEHPNVVACRGFESPCWFAMDYVPGDLSRLKGRLYTDSAVVEIARQMALGLAELHERHIVHHDLKPQNVLWDVHDGTALHVARGRDALVPYQGPVQDGGIHVRVADLGASGWVREFSAPQGKLVGTAAYLSPEQVRREPLDQRSDMVAFGLILYELFTGTRAYDAADTQGVLLQAYRAQVPVPARRKYFFEVRERGAAKAEESYGELLCSLIAACTSLEAGERPHARDVAYSLAHAQRHALEEFFSGDAQRAAYGGVMPCPERRHARLAPEGARVVRARIPRELAQ